jgi:hypothetical protein
MNFDQKIIAQLNRMETEIQTIKRGVYGDQQNKVKGLIQTDLEQHVRIKKLEDVKKKAIWIAAGFILAVEGIMALIKLNA